MWIIFYSNNWLYDKHDSVEDGSTIFFPSRNKLSHFRHDQIMQKKDEENGLGVVQYCVARGKQGLARDNIYFYGDISYASFCM